MKNILVTGGAGYIGDCVVENLLNAGCNVTVVDNLMYGGTYMRRHLTKTSMGTQLNIHHGDGTLTFRSMDIRDEKKLTWLLSTFDWDAVVHLAAIVGDGACAARPDLTVAVNEVATKNIAAICAARNIKLIFASTCSVYGANNDMLDEQSPTNPLSLYAGTKLAAEKFVKEVPGHYIFRLGTVFGVSTEFARLRCDLVANVLTYKAINGEALTVFGGEQWRPLIHVRDVGRLFALAALTDKPVGTYILSSGNFMIKDVAKLITKIVAPVPLNITDMKFEDLRNYKVSSAKAIANGFETQMTLIDGIGEMRNVVMEGRVADVWNPAFHNAKYIEEVMKK
jgi:nucleoside-diphosphate-sugar epimerase